MYIRVSISALQDDYPLVSSAPSIQAVDLALDTSAIEIDPETESLLKAINFENLPGVKVTTPVAPVAPRRNTRPRKTEA
ncbi:Putative 40S ribosomal protein S17-A [Rhizopus microsporus]|nr:Putative 40S ribosomal protein S17-A [Rhizopus microsporus]